MNVYFFSGQHPIYESILTHPPENVKYTTNVKFSEFNKLKVYGKVNTLKRDIFTKTLDVLRLPRFYYVRNKADIIHSSRGFLILNKKPWVMDIEHAASFVGMRSLMLPPAKSKIEKMLSSKHCKKIMPHCIASEKSVLKFFNTSKFKDKIETVYPAIPAMNFKKKKSNKIRLLFVSRLFHEKGGKETLEAFDILRKKYDNIELVMRCDVPQEYKQKYGNDRIKFLEGKRPRSEIFELYKESDIFVMPTYGDSFGFALVEAMSFGLPVISTDVFAIPEIIEDGKNGFMVHSEQSWAGKDYLHNSYGRNPKKSPFPASELAQKLSFLIEDGKLLKSMSKNSKNMIANGKFSIKERNKKLKRIYEDALKR